MPGVSRFTQVRDGIRSSLLRQRSKIRDAAAFAKESKIRWAGHKVPYTNVDFNDWRCPKKNIEGSDYQYNAEAVRNCRLVGLLDLDQGRPEVREKLIAFLNHLIDLGIAGFRCDASKHMWPGDLMLILNGTRNLREDIFGPNQRPFIVHEVIDRGHEAIKVAEYTGLGRYTNFNFGGAVSAAAKGTTGWDLLSSLGPGYGYGNGADNDVLNFIDNHDNQRDDHPYVVTYKDGDRYRLAVAYMMAWPYGYPRVMSSFYFDHRDQGPPHSGSKTGYATRSPTFVSHDETCNVTSGWVCEHRWPTIREMAKFRSTVKGAAATQIVKDNNRLAFARRGRGFFAINGNNGKWGRFFATTMPEGNYCDQYAGSLKNGKCTGRTIHVKKNGQAFLRIGGKQAVAFSLASRIGDPPVRPDLEDYSKTVILIKKNTHGGQYVFIRGGTSHANDDECQPGLYQQRNDKCAIPIMHNTTVPFVYNEYLSWSQGDEFLDFEGPEEEQGTYNGRAASGTPLAYSTNNPSEFEYNQHNKYGPSYWLVELFVDCSKTDQGWFELKGYLTPSHEWEPNINQGKCTGSIGGSAPFRSINHIAKCDVDISLREEDLQNRPNPWLVSRMGVLIYLLSCFYLATAYNYYWYDEPQTLPNRQAMVHLFEWKWTDIAAECESFLQHYGYGAVQISPPNEHISFVLNNDIPWYIRYQPVSYQLISRSGNEAQFKDMVNRCNKVGVRIIVDVVMNHMVGVSQKSGVDGKSGSGGSSFDGTDGVEQFPGVPYTKSDFNDYRCHRDIQGSDYQNSAQSVKNCRLVGLLDLDQSNAEVRSKLIAYLDQLIDYGVAGFRCDASKHMWPDDLMVILNGTKNLREDIFGLNQRPFVVHEVIDRGGEAVKCSDYIGIGRYTNFNFGAAVSSAAKGNSDWKLLSNLGPGYAYGNLEDHDVLNFIDNHDNQRDTSPYVVTYKDGDRYRMAVAYMLAWSYGYPRVMSSYYFSQHDQGPPNSGAGNGYATTSPTFNTDQTCNSASGWVCEHRWPTIREMTKFRSAVEGAAATEIFTDNQRIAFAREGKGFFALNGNDRSWSKNFPTTMPAGTYCDQYAGSLENGKCTRTTITVGQDGSAYLQIDSRNVIAFSLASRIGAAPNPTTVPKGYLKTVILLKKDTYQGQSLFIRGGVSHANNNVCSPGPYQQQNDKCAIPMVHNTSVPFAYIEYLSWSQGDNFLDFEGAEQNQGTHDGQVSFGTPLAYSTNNPSDYEYQPYNKYGTGYWLVQLLVDCSKSDQGWFELKGYASPSIGWEPNIAQSACTGKIGGSAPFQSVNHIAKCGNRFLVS
ncbi:hypothetical protein RB195_015117 [Necator americanus]|uniref:alpha-amylase n=1 Tax=Necator americanus TaxID=51031 RepID=A0ABR1E4V0_NECAM